MLLQEKKKTSIFFSWASTTLEPSTRSSGLRHSTRVRDSSRLGHGPGECRESKAISKEKSSMVEYYGRHLVGFFFFHLRVGGVLRSSPHRIFRFSFAGYNVAFIFVSVGEKAEKRRKGTSVCKGCGCISRVVSAVTQLLNRGISATAPTGALVKGLLQRVWVH